MRKSCISIFLFGVLLLAATCNAQNATTETQLKTIDAFVADLMRADKVAGGLELVQECAPLEPKPLDFKGPLIQALRKLSQVDPSLSWRQSGSTYLVTINRSGSARLTSVHLPALQFSARTLDEASDILLQQQRVRDRIRELRLAESPSNIGFSSINERELRQISLPEGTLGEDLNALAAAFGSAIWQLDQRTCGNNSSYRLAWISK
jgi:hypothetical protein